MNYDLSRSMMDCTMLSRKYVPCAPHDFPEASPRNRHGIVPVEVVIRFSMVHVVGYMQGYCPCRACDRVKNKGAVHSTVVTKWPSNHTVQVGGVKEL